MSKATTQAPPATGTFCWNELMTHDTEAAKSFYTKLFGWTTREMDMGPQGTYTIFINKGQDIGGMMACPKKEIPAHWLTYVAVDDVDASTGNALQLGATTCVPPTDIPNIGRFSVVTDPTGSTIAMYKSAK